MKPLILIVNDAGVYSPGLCAAAEAVQDLGSFSLCCIMGNAIIRRDRWYKDVI